MKKHWNYNENQSKHKGRSLTLKECEEYGVRLSDRLAEQIVVEFRVYVHRSH